MSTKNRRSFFRTCFKSGLGLAVVPQLSLQSKASSVSPAFGESSFQISLAEWSVREWLNSDKISNLEFPVTAKEVFGIEAVEYVSSFFRGKETDAAYLKELKQRCVDINVRNVLIMVDMWGPDGTLASPDAGKREAAANNHHKWVEAASFLGCHAIRVNASGYGNSGYEDSKKYFADGLNRLVEYGKKNKLSILVENHGGFSSNGRWLAEVMREVNSDYCGTLPDFGNFRISKEDGIFYDPLVGLSELMPFAKGVSAKANQFDVQGSETTIDYQKMIEIVKTSGFKGYVGIEWGGGGYSNMSAESGIRATKNILEKLLPL